ncbi:MAG: alginate lyase family protein [Candidatus Saccharibacteria bacterium]
MTSKTTRKTSGRKTSARNNVPRSKPNSSFNAPFKFSSKQLAIVLALILVIGGIIVWRVLAATSQTEVETWPASGGNTKTVADNSASGGSYLEFLAPTASTTVTPASGFVHPGVLVSQSQLDFVKAKIASGQEPWTSAFNKMKSNSLASRTYTPSPVPKLMCSTSVGLGEGFPQAGCTEMNRDGAATYTQALMYAYTGDITYANNAAKIINAWTSTLKEIPYDQPRTSTGAQAYWQNLLVVGWSTETMTRGAEIIRYTSSAMTPAQITQSETWLKGFIYPFLNSYTAGGNGNGGMTWTEAIMNIGVYTNDRAIYDKAVAWYKVKMPQLIYLTSDGARPPLPTDANTGKPWSWGTGKVDELWRYPTQWVNGLETETCRDMGHTFMGLGPMSNIAETAYIQGTNNFYADYKDRMVAAYELNAGYTNQMLDEMARSGLATDKPGFDAISANGWMPTNFPCSDFISGGGSSLLGTEIAYNHFAKRLGLSMPNTKKLAERTRPQAGGNHLFFESLTHYQAP